jgi:hypothetical protein
MLQVHLAYSQTAAGRSQGRTRRSHPGECREHLGLEPELGIGERITLEMPTSWASFSRLRRLRPQQAADRHDESCRVYSPVRTLTARPPGLVIVVADPDTVQPPAIPGMHWVNLPAIAVVRIVGV